MGTNYYLHLDVCPCCQQSAEYPLHIGKSSAGWCFGLHVRGGEWEEELPIDLDGWRELWSRPNNIIKDEYGEVITPEAMEATITQRKWRSRDERIPYGYKSWDEFDRKNHSRTGPGGLSRHVVDGHHCIGNGEGTWDLIVGDFS